MSLALLIAACGGSQPPPTPVSNTAPAHADAGVDAPPAGMAAALIRMEQFADQICHCSDKTCLQREAEAMTKWGAEFAKIDQSHEKTTDEDTKRAEAISKRITECFAKVYGQQGGSASQP